MSPDDGSFPLICSSSLTIANRARYTNIPPPIITSRIAPSRAAVRVMVPPGGQISIPEFVVLSGQWGHQWYSAVAVCKDQSRRRDERKVGS